MNEANELNIQIEELQQGESGYFFDSMLDLTIELFRFQDIRASSYWQLLKPFNNSKSNFIEQNDDFYCFYCIFWVIYIKWIITVKGCHIKKTIFMNSIKVKDSFQWK